jgi:Fe-S-cluster formation regulator IscX/YfhJ/predicted nuclease of predicted toxin-antitoxin system
MEKKDKRIAVLIDADNVSDKYIKHIIDEISNHGIPTYKRIYGDWTKPQLGPWKNVLLNYSISPIQQYSYTTGKNASDAALIIDAMDILYSGNVDGFCIVSSDSDFTKLAARLREAGMLVIGMGEKKTPKPFIAACERFKYLEVLASMAQKVEVEDDKTKTSSVDSKNGMTSKEQLIETVKTIISEVSDEDGWAYLGEIGSILNKRYPDFDTRNYGFTKLTPFVSSLTKFEIRSVKTSNPSITLKYVRVNQAVPSKKKSSTRSK